MISIPPNTLRQLTLCGLLSIPSGIGCGASTVTNELQDASAHSDTSDASTTCNPYDSSFSPLPPTMDSHVYDLMGLGGSEGQFVCYSRLFFSPGSPPVPDGERDYTLFNRISGQRITLPVVHNFGSSQGDCSVSDDGHLMVVNETSSSPTLNSQILLFDVTRPDRPRRILISQSPTGDPGDDQSMGARITPDGNNVFFISRAHNLTTDVNTDGGIFVYDVGARTLRRLSTPPGLHFLGGAGLSISTNGRRLAFSAPSSDDARLSQGYVFDLDTETTVRFSSSSSGESSNGGVANPYLSGNGHRIAFTSDATNLDGNNNGYGNVFLWEEGNGIRILTSSPMGSPPLYGPSEALGISRDGNRVLVDTNIALITPGLRRPYHQLFALDLNSGRRALIGDGHCGYSQLGSRAFIDASGHSGVASFFRMEQVPGLSAEGNPLVFFGIDSFFH